MIELACPGIIWLQRRGKRFKQRFILRVHALAQRKSALVFKVPCFQRSDNYEVLKALAIDLYV